MSLIPSSTTKSARPKLAVALLVALAALAATAIAVIAAPAKPDFSVAGRPTTQTVTTGQAVAYDITVTRSGGFSNSITLGAVTGLPNEVTATWPSGRTHVLPATTATTTTVRLTVQTGKSTPEGSKSLGITATSGRTIRSTTVTLVVQDPPLPTTFPIRANLAGRLQLDGPAGELDLSMTNPYNQPLNVTNLRVAIGSVAPAACGAGNFELTQVNDGAATTLTIPPTETRTLTQLGVKKPTVRWVNRDYLQDACKGANLTFAYSANGTTGK